ncbi:CoA pyrophosphatase [Massilia sp. CF038]|uniref:CoA pyrophosphatase n=1 Tax=Massilia sp. CF038 TaxID=1881045 RepID=UPI000922D05F|nr:CoA pyrophosphatase [Massilia sp. CF038]SHH17302.1 8-oxo-dGTP pyrophosphatase MutT, NUDIX family [Massilia sp. CF038]
MSKISFDPEKLPVDAVGAEGALDAERLLAHWLRARFANPVAWEAEPAEAAFMQRERITAAAVLIALVEREAGLSMLLTQRTAHLTDHAGQISFPGGRAEDYDSSSVDTALREAEEEIGLDRQHVEVLGTLPDYVTGTGYRVTPVVGLVKPPFALTPDPDEVAEIFEVPLAFLMNAENHRRLSFDMPDGAGKRSFYAMPYERFFIWGATAGMLRNLFHFLRA